MLPSTPTPGTPAKRPDVKRLDEPTPVRFGGNDVQLRADLTNRYDALTIMLVSADALARQLYDRLRILAAQEGLSHELSALAVIAQQICEAHHPMRQHAAAWHELESAVMGDHVEAGAGE